MPSDNQKSTDSSEDICDTPLFCTTVDNVFISLTIIFLVLLAALIGPNLMMMISREQTNYEGDFIRIHELSIAVTIPLLGLFALVSLFWFWYPVLGCCNSPFFMTLVASGYTYFLHFLFTDFDHRCPENMGYYMELYFFVLKYFIVPTFIVTLLFGAFAKYKTNKLMAPAKAAPSEFSPLLSDQKMLWGTVGEVFAQLADVFAKISFILFPPLVHGIYHGVTVGFEDTVSFKDNIAAGSIGLWVFFNALIASLITRISPSFFHKRLWILLLLLTLYGVKEQFTAIDIIYENHHTLQLDHYNATYIASLITIPILLITSLLSALAFYKTSRIKVPKYYDGPDRYEVLYGGESSSTKWIKKRKTD